MTMGSWLPSARAEVPTHDIAAASLVVVQQPPATNINALTVTASSSVNDFRVRDGSNGGDYNVQIGDDPLDDTAGGVLMSSVAEHQRNHGAGAFSAVNMVAKNTSGYFIPTSAAAGLGAGANPEFNINVAGAWFPFANWIGAHVQNIANGGPLTDLVGSPSLVLGTHFIDSGNGKSVVDLTSLGIDSRTNGVLLVSGGKNESANFGLGQVNTTNGTWNLFIKDVGQATIGSFEQDGIAFVFIPKTNTSVVSGRFMGDGSIAMFSGASPQFTVANTGAGLYELKITGRPATNGVLIISAEGGGAVNQDNFVTYQTNAANDGWIIQTRDTPAAGLEALSAAEAVVSFVYIPIATPGITASPSGNLLTTESGVSANFTVRLDTAPTSDVTVTVASSNTGEGAVSTGSLTFTTTDWNIPQSVTVTGQDDAVADGTVAYNVVLTPSSADAIYNTLPAVNVGAANADNEGGITITPTSGLITSETGGAATFSVRLNTQPNGDVTVSFSSSNPNEGTSSPASLTFNSGNWDQEQIITVTGVNDFVDDGTVNYTIVSAPATSSDSIYNGFNAADVSVANEDDDIANITVTPLSGLTVTEAGSTATYTIVLQTQPTENVVVNVTSSDTTEGTVSPASLTFTASNWNTPKTVTITGVDDLVQDGSVAYTITNVFSSTDPVYAVFPAVTVSALTFDTEAIITLSTVDTFYSPGLPALGVDGRATIIDPYTPAYNAGNLTVTLTANGSADDRLEIRHTGTGAGQVGVSGNTVSYGGTAIGTFTGGTGTTPLAFTLNSAATPTATEALLRSVTFRTLNTNLTQVSRTVSVAFVDGDGGLTPTVSKTIRVGLVRQSQFQEGADWGYGVYTGAADIQLHQSAPDTVYPIGHNTNSGLWLNWPDAATANASQALLRFDNIFGTAPGLVPTNAVIVATELVLNVNDSGDASPLYRMLIPWDAETTTWNTFGGILPNDSIARSVANSQFGLADGSGSTGTGSISFSVTPDIMAWANGETNYGWGMPGWFERTDGTGVSPCEDPDIKDRPRLRVLWVPAGTLQASFRQGVNGYTNAFDTRIRQSAADTNFVTSAAAFVDAIVTGTTNDPEQILVRFDNIIGSDVGQIPPYAVVHAAILDLASTINSAMGDGGVFHSLLQPWQDTTTTWNSWTNGIEADGVDALSTPTTTAGYAALNPNVQAGYNSYELTSDVQAWASGTRNNYGWGILPWPGGGDGWGVNLSKATVEQDRPQLRVFYSPGVPPSNVVIGSLTWSPTSVTIQFTGAQGTTYSVLRSGTVSGGYAPIGTATAGSGGAASFTDNAPLAGTGFYRISNP